MFVERRFLFERLNALEIGLGGDGNQPVGERLGDVRALEKAHVGRARIGLGVFQQCGGVEGLGFDLRAE